MEREPATLQEYLGEMCIGDKSVAVWVIGSLGFLQEAAGLEPSDVRSLAFNPIVSEKKGDDIESLVAENTQLGHSLAFNIEISKGRVNMISAYILTEKGLFWRIKTCGKKEQYREIIFR
jgi:hypothetical protein